MEPPLGTRDSRARRAGGFFGTAGRVIGFCLLSGAALGLFATTVLLPEYARMVRAEYELARQQAANADLQALIQANQRLIGALPDNAVLTKRLAMSQFGLLPADEVVMVANYAAGPRPPVMALTTPHQRPQRPDARLMGLAQRLSKPRTRRGLLLLAAAAVLAALFLFPAREPERARHPHAADS